MCVCVCVLEARVSVYNRGRGSCRQWNAVVAIVFLSNLFIFFFSLRFWTSHQVVGRYGGERERQEAGAEIKGGKSLKSSRESQFFSTLLVVGEGESRSIPVGTVCMRSGSGMRAVSKYSENELETILNAELLLLLLRIELPESKQKGGREEAAAAAEISSLLITGRGCLGARDHVNIGTATKPEKKMFGILWCSFKNISSNPPPPLLFCFSHCREFLLAHIGL